MRVRIIAFALSLANLTLLRIYADYMLITNVVRNQYYVEALPSRQAYVAWIVNLLALSAIIVFIREYRGRRPESKWRSGLWYGACTVLASIAAVGFLRLGGLANSGFLANLRRIIEPVLPAGVSVALAVLLAAACITAAITWRRFVCGAAAAGVLVLAPFALITLGQAAVACWTSSDDAPGFADKVSARSSKTSEAPHSRVVWLLFDELDYRVAFEQRPASIALPELDRLRSEAVFASHAFPPADRTDISVPALTAGQMLEGTQAVRPDELMLHVRDGAPEPWSTHNIFGEVQRRDWSAAIVGWAHPYCRVFGDSLRSCYSRAVAAQSDSLGATLGSLLVNQWRSLLETPRLSPFGQALVVQESVRRLIDLRDRAGTLLARSENDLVFIHLPIPHPPYPYDARTGKLTRANNLTDGYLDNLVLVDRTLGGFRRALEANGSWDRVTVIVTSDHRWRFSHEYDGKEDWRVPLLIKMPHQKAGVEYERTFNTVALHDLILAIMNGKVSVAPQVLSWLDEHAKAQPPLLHPDFD